MNRPSPYPDNTYTPMGRRPELLECGRPVHTAHISPPCCLVGWLLHETRMEIDERLHVLAVPGHVEPIPVHLRDPNGPKEMVSDSGPLGGRPWSRSMERRMGIKFFQGEWTLDDHEYRPYPVSRAIVGVRRFCSSKHASWPEHRGEPVCWNLLRSIAEGKQSVYRAADSCGVTPERARYLLHRFDGRVWQGSLDKVWTWVANELNGIPSSRSGNNAA